MRLNLKQFDTQQTLGPIKIQPFLYTYLKHLAISNVRNMDLSFKAGNWGAPPPSFKF